MTDLDRLVRNQRVVIPKGTPIIWTTHKDGLTQARTTHTIKFNHYRGNSGIDRTIVWAGPSGYWREVRITDELREANR
jgi:hypothetical protein